MGFASGIKNLEAGEAALGRRVYRPGVATDLGTLGDAEVNLFRVSVGNVMLTMLYGKVRTAIGAGLTEIELWFTPDGGPGAATPANMCIDSADINDGLADTIYTITGGVGDAMTISAALGVAVASFCTNRLILVPGIISLGVEDAINTGIIDWTLHYVPQRLDARVAPL